MVDWTPFAIAAIAGIPGLITAAGAWWAIRNRASSAHMEDLHRHYEVQDSEIQKQNSEIRKLETRVKELEHHLEECTVARASLVEQVRKMELENVKLELLLEKLKVEHDLTEKDMERLI